MILLFLPLLSFLSPDGSSKHLALLGRIQVTTEPGYFVQTLGVVYTSSVVSTCRGIYINVLQIFTVGLLSMRGISIC
jgi:hypothetical protein